MRWWAVFLALLVLPSVSAYSAWHYSGDTFKQEGILYSVEGFTYDKVLLGVDGQTYMLSLGDCKETSTAKYCFNNTAYPDDDAHIKYQGGKQFYGYYLTINAVNPKLEVTRKITTNNPGVGESVDIDVTIKNTADVGVESILYAEALPAGVAASGQGVGWGSVSYEIKTLAPGQTRFFSYSLTPKEYVNTNLKANVTYEYNGKSFNATVAPLALLVVTPLEATGAISPTINLDEVGNYTLNLTNTDKSRTMNVKVVLQMPPGLRHTSVDGFTAGPDNRYTADIELEPKQKTALRILFTGSVGGKYSIPVNVTGTAGGVTFRRYYNETVTTKADLLKPTITLSSTRTAYRPGDSLTISGLLENTNAVTTFTRISGALSAPGLFAPVDFKHQEFPPRRNLTEAEQMILIPDVNETKMFTITLSGYYATPGGEAFSYNTTKTITVAPVRDIVNITRTVEPQRPAPGQNVTVTVSAKNVFNQYISFTTREAYDLALTKASGITYSENSLERDTSKQLYIYQLTIPADYNASEINLSTVISVKGEAEQRATTTIFLSSAKNESVAKNTTAGEAKATEIVVETKPAQKKGFFAEVWQFLKDLF